MIRQDYILRMIEQVGELVRRLLNREISQVDIETEFEELIDQWIGLPASTLLSLPASHVYRLLEDSDRMVMEKSYLMGEIHRAKGMGTEIVGKKMEHFECSLFFYNKCSGQVDAMLQDEIDKRLLELADALEERTNSPQSNVIEDPLPIPQPMPRSKLASKRKRRNARLFWASIASGLIFTVVYTLFEQAEVEIVDQTWAFEGDVAVAQFRIVNNASEERLIKLKLSIERYTSGTFKSGYTFLGAVERDYKIAPESSRSVNERFETVRNVSGPNRSVSIDILSIQPTSSDFTQ